MDSQFVVHGEAGSGSVAVEAALTLLGLPYRVVETTTADPFGAPGTPAGQVPALTLPDGTVVTESAAILLWLADSHPASRLSPTVDSPLRPTFLRWMMFVSASIYAHYWARDFPARLVTGAEAQAELYKSLGTRICDRWALMERSLTPRRYLLGDDLTVLDLYVKVIAGWTPRETSFATLAPRLCEVVGRVEADPRLAALWAERFPLKAAAPAS